jgi:transcriptional regulator with XRE-family HTH domain
MEYKGITASELADSIGVQRSNVTHVLKARNKPSFQFIEKMLQIYPDLNAKWLLLGTGNMVDAPMKSKTLFDQLTEPVIPESQVHVNTEETKQKDSTIIQKDEKIEDSKSASIPQEIQNTSEKRETNDALKDQFFSSEKQIERMIVFFTDQTFKVYSPSR